MPSGAALAHGATTASGAALAHGATTASGANPASGTDMMSGTNDEKRVWHSDVSLEDLQAFLGGNMLDHLGIMFTEIGPDYLSGSMPVDHRTMQPYGLLHGGASVVLAETLASVAANLRVDPASSTCVGLDLSSNHVRQVTEGIVSGTARPIHLGRRTQVWDVTISNQGGRLVNTTRITLLVLDRPQFEADEIRDRRLH